MKTHIWVVVEGVYGESLATPEMAFSTKKAAVQRLIDFGYTFSKKDDLWHNDSNQHWMQIEKPWRYVLWHMRRRGSMKRKALKYICWASETLCRLTHPFVRVEILLTGTHCNLALWSSRLDEKYDLGVWSKEEG